MRPAESQAGICRLGTIEELMETITWLQLGYHRKPVGLLNVNGYFDHLLLYFDNCVDQVGPTLLGFDAPTPTATCQSTRNGHEGSNNGHARVFRGSSATVAGR